MGILCLSHTEPVEVCAKALNIDIVIHWSHSLVETMQFIARLSVFTNIYIFSPWFSVSSSFSPCNKKILLLHRDSERKHREAQRLLLSTV